MFLQGFLPRALLNLQGWEAESWTGASQSTGFNENDVKAPERVFGFMYLLLSF